MRLHTYFWNYMEIYSHAQLYVAISSLHTFIFCIFLVRHPPPPPRSEKVNKPKIHCWETIAVLLHAFQTLQNHIHGVYREAICDRICWSLTRKVNKGHERETSHSHKMQQRRLSSLKIDESKRGVRRQPATVVFTSMRLPYWLNIIIFIIMSLFLKQIVFYSIIALSSNYYIYRWLHNYRFYEALFSRRYMHCLLSCFIPIVNRITP